jgi:hypothetical protein
MQLTKRPSPTEPLNSANQLRPGVIYVAEGLPGSAKSGLQEGMRLVLGTAGEKRALELIGIASTPAPINAPGTYLSASDYQSLKTRSSPTLRRYRRRDTWIKALSARGAAIVAPAVITLIAAVVGIFFLSSTSAAPAGGEQATALFEWVSQPALSNPSPTTIAKRAEQAQRCMTLINGHEAPPTTIPGISCSPPTLTWSQDPLVGSLFAGGFALLAALVAFLPLRKQFGFQGTAAT